MGSLLGGSMGRRRGRSGILRSDQGINLRLIAALACADELFEVTLEDEPKVRGNVGEIKPEDLEKVKQFGKMNFNELLAMWNQELQFWEVIWDKVD